MPKIETRNKERLTVCLVVIEGMRKGEKRVKEVKGKEMKKKIHPYYTFGRSEGAQGREK